MEPLGWGDFHHGELAVSEVADCDFVTTAVPELWAWQDYQEGDALVSLDGQEAALGRQVTDSRH